MPEYLDTDLVNDFKQAQKEAFDELYARFYARIYAFCLSLVDNTAESADITIESINALFKKNADFDSIQNIQAFLYVTARNRCLNYLRDMKRAYDARKRILATLTEAEANNDWLDIEFVHAIKRSIEQLPVRQRETIEYLYFSDKKYDYATIAEKMNISVNTVDSHRKKALAVLRETLHWVKSAETVTPFLLFFWFWF